MNTSTTAHQHAVDFLRKRGMEVIDHNPDNHIDIAVWCRKTDEIIFVEIVERKTPPKIRRTDWKKRTQQRKAIRRWLRDNKWLGKHRFDVIEIYGEERPVIDHILNVNLKK